MGEAGSRGPVRRLLKLIQTRSNEGLKHPTAVRGKGPGTGPPGSSLQVGCLSHLCRRGHRWLIHGNTWKGSIFN